MATDDTAADAMVDACLRLHEMTLRVGNPEWIELARLLLYQAGTQIADEIRIGNGGRRARATRH